MSFRGSLAMGGVEMDVISCEFELSRNTDEKGRPASGVYGGRVTFEIESTADTSVVEAMVNSQFKPFEFTVTFKKTDEDAKMKELVGTNVYLVYYHEILNVNGKTPMKMRFTLSAEELTMGNATHINRWPQG